MLPLMVGLATYEGYLPAFAIDEAALIRSGFTTDPPAFHALVGESTSREIVGMLVYYLVPFTYRGTPTLYVKELFITESCRGSGLGEGLMREAAKTALELGCGAMKWQVARWNRDGARFYERLGAQSDDGWIDYGLDPVAMTRLVEG